MSVSLQFPRLLLLIIIIKQENNEWHIVKD